MPSLLIRARDQKQPEESDEESDIHVDTLNHGIAFAELVSYIEKCSHGQSSCSRLQTHRPS